MAKNVLFSICLGSLCLRVPASKLIASNDLRGILQQPSQATLGSARKTAVCAAGHVRTLVLPTVYKSLKTNLLDTNNADLFLVGGLGKMVTESGQGNRFNDWLASRNKTESSDLQLALDFLKPKYCELHLNDCAKLQKAWASDGITNRVCRESHRGDGNFLQVMWVDHCFHKIRTDPIAYDLIIRTRPDVGIFQKMHPTIFPVANLGYMPKEQMVGMSDWFFSAPPSQLAKWWDRVVKDYLEGENGMLDGGPPGTPEKEQLKFPVVIVRGPSDAKCEVIPFEDLANQCRQVWTYDRTELWRIS